MILADVTGITIPEGEVAKIECGGEVIWERKITELDAPVLSLDGETFYWDAVVDAECYNVDFRATDSNGNFKSGVTKNYYIGTSISLDDVKGLAGSWKYVTVKVYAVNKTAGITSEASNSVVYTKE